MDEGIIKFNLEWDKTGPVIKRDQLDVLNSWRDLFYSMGLLGIDENGLTFGNISMRLPEDRGFIISVSGSGKYKSLTNKHYAEVYRYSFDDNKVWCRGPATPSSESLTHSAIYESKKEIHGVVHIHHHEYWKELKHWVPTTPNNVSYGSPEMAESVKQLFASTNIYEKRIMIMAGHEGGIITFGQDLDEAGRYLIAYINNIL